tara:strand:- start:864 stop:3068 length:2205 start_codon:yes stop_codon:yes gene_type:complete
MKYRLFFILLILNFLIPNEIYKQIKINHVDVDDISLFQISGLDIDHANYEDGHFIEFAISEYDISILDNLGYDYEIIHEDLQRFYESRLTENYTREFGLGSMGGYYTLDEAIQRLDEIHQEYPNFVSEKISIGQSFEGRNIYAIKVTSNISLDENKPQVLYTGMHHAREPMSFMNLYYFIYWVLENYNIDDDATQILNTREMWFIPIVNPDGYEYNRSIAPNGGGMQRKNMRNTCNGSADGIDPNRNYDYMWGLDNQGSSPEPCSETYRGTSAFSEPETQAVRDFVEQNDFTIAMNYHSYSNLLIYPFGYSYDNPMDPDDLNTFIEYAEDMTQYNNYAIGTGTELLYPVNGEACDWMYGAHGIFAYTPEVGSSNDGFWPSSNRIVPLAEENLYPNIRTALYGGALISSDLSIEEGPYLGNNWYSIDVLLNNIGLSSSQGITTLEFTSYDGIEFSDNIIEIDEIDPRSSINLEEISEFYISPYIPSGVETEITLIMTMEDGSQSSSDIVIIIGQPEAVLQDGFESNQEGLDWTLSGNSDWYITSENSSSGSYSFRSGEIGDNQESTASISFDATSISTIEFSYRVSSEYSPSQNNFYDGLTFYIDNNQIGQYQPNGNGESPWIDLSFSVSQGFHTLTWTYSKDGGGGATDCNNTSCDDAAFIDDFVLYSYVDTGPILLGDLNSDTVIDILDVVLLVNFVLEATSPSDIEFIAGDINQDGILNILDVVQVVNIILS